MPRQPNRFENELSVLEEVFYEAQSKCNNADCRCATCSSRNSGNRSNPTLQEVQELGWQLNNEEELELSKAFEKIKRLAKKGYNKARPLIVTADIIRRLISPPVDPVPVMKDVAAFIEQDKARKRQEAIERARRTTKNNFTQKPDPEMSLLQEILLESNITKPTLRYGSRGSNVAYLQKKLNQHYSSIIPLKEDGIWGQKTHAAVLQFQRSRKLTVDGVVGPKTWVALEATVQPLVVPRICPAVHQTLVSEVSAPSVAPPARSKFRPCCLLAPSPNLTPEFGDPKKLGTHNAPDELVSIIYTGKAGFVDLGHVRDLCDLTKFVFDQLMSGRGHTVPIVTTEGEAKLLKCPADLLRTARAISYDDAIAHEIVSYAQRTPGGHNSSFSPEDLCSNNLGSIIAERAILTILKTTTPKTFNAEVTSILNTVMTDLDAQTPAESKKAFDMINGRWVKFSTRGSLLNPTYLKRRNFDLIPWKVGHPADSATPSWVTDRPASSLSLYVYACTNGTGFTNVQFGREINSVKADAALNYGPDFDKP